MDVISDLAVWSILPLWQTALLSLHALVVLVALSRHFVCSYQMRRTRFLTPDCPGVEGEEAPLISIMVPAKDEASTIAECLESLLAQDYPNFEVLVVDDRSEDETAAIVEEFADRDDRIRLIRVQHLPTGWTGKTHALHVCQEHAYGDWLLFVDADTRQHPKCLSVVMRDCLDHGADMESLLPALESHSFWERVIQPFAATCLVILFPLTRVNNARCKSGGFANGQFILVHRDAYEKIGGHEKVRDKFVEDIQLGRNVREAGLGLRLVVASALSRVRMYSTLDAIVNGWSRIFYSAVDFRPAKLYMLFTFICLFSVLPYAVILGYGAALLSGIVSPFIVMSFGLGLVHELIQSTLYARTYATSKSQTRYLAFRWLAVIAMLHILRKTIKTCRTHEVTWRGTAYTKDLQKAA